MEFDEAVCFARTNGGGASCRHEDMQEAGDEMREAGLGAGITARPSSPKVATDYLFVAPSIHSMFELHDD